MTDHNKVRDELARKSVNRDMLELREADGRERHFKLGFDAAIAHLAKQSVKLDEQDLWRSLGYDDEREPAVTPILHGGRLAHNNCALIYEAKLAKANGLVRSCAGFVYNHDNVGITKAEVKSYIEELEKLGAK